MAKKWLHLRSLMQDAAFNVPESDSHEDLFFTIHERFRSAVRIEPCGNGRLRVDGVEVNAAAFYRRAIASVESRGPITSTSFIEACHTIARAMVLKESKAHASRVSRLNRLTWDTALTLGASSGRVFYESIEWKRLRYKVLSVAGGACQLCGATAKDGVQIHVDHIKPRSVYPELALDFDNLQVLCEPCNLGKGKRDHSDWRPARESA